MSHVNPFFSTHILTPKLTKEILASGSFGVEYQPIVSLKDGRFLGYEALARFVYQGMHIPPNLFFDALHEDIALFCKAESIIKAFQFAHRPKNECLYVNIDPHIFQYPEGTEGLLQRLLQEENIVVELVENSYTTLHAKEIFDVFLSKNLTLAVDDFFQENSMLSLYLLKACHVLKLDRCIIHELRCDSAFSNVVRGLVAFAHAKNKTVIFEGIETEEDLLLAEALGCDGVQGFFFRPLFFTHFN